MFPALHLALAGLILVWSPPAPPRRPRRRTSLPRRPGRPTPRPSSNTARRRPGATDDPFTARAGSVPRRRATSPSAPAPRRDRRETGGERGSSSRGSRHGRSGSPRRAMPAHEGQIGLAGRQRQPGQDVEQDRQLELVGEGVRHPLQPCRPRPLAEGRRPPPHRPGPGGGEADPPVQSSSPKVRTPGRRRGRGRPGGS